MSDENDETPAFGSATYMVSTDENLPVDSSLGSFMATDADAGDSITYYITGNSLILGQNTPGQNPLDKTPRSIPLWTTPPPPPPGGQTPPPP